MKIVKDLFDVVKQIPTLFSLYHYIINISFDVPPNLVFQDDVYALLICTPPVLEPECHLSIVKDFKRCDECYFSSSSMVRMI
jgi:hypothetical protein